MGLFTRLVLTVVLTVFVTQLVIFLLTPLFFDLFYSDQVATILGLSDSDSRELAELVKMNIRRSTIFVELWSLPVAAVLALALAYLYTRRITRSVDALVRESQQLVGGRQRRDICLAGADEFNKLANAFNALAQDVHDLEAQRVAHIAMVAHELRTPLSALQGYLEALADETMVPERVLRELTSLRRTTNDLLLAARVEAGSVEIHPTPIAVASLLNDVQERFEGAFEAQGVAFKLELTHPWPPVKADKERVTQVLSNLLSNALRYTRCGGSVTLATKETQGWVTFSVSDTGIGIAPEHQARVFERFYRVNKARSQSVGGTGIGLSISRGLIEAMGGEIGLKSQLGKGSRFYFKLPKAAP